MKPVYGIALAALLLGTGASLIAILGGGTSGMAESSATVAPMTSPTAPATSGAAADPTLARLAGWDRWDSTRQTAAIAGIMSDPRLSPGMVGFLLREVGNRRLEPGTRNNIANALMAQDAMPAGLAERFLAMADDRGESPTWRDYAVQRLVATIPPGGDAQPIAAKLLELVAQGEGSLPGTALIQLAQLVESGRLPREGAYTAALVQLAGRPGAPLANRMTAVARLGEQGDAAQAQVVRALLTADAEPALARVAIAALGLIGEQADRELIRPYLVHANQAVAMAAQAAIRRLDNPRKPL
jgi:hypothetical protein